MPRAAARNANGTRASKSRRRRRAPSSHPPVEPKRPSGSMVQASRGEPPFAGVKGAPWIFPKTAGTVGGPAAAGMVLAGAEVAPEVRLTLAGAKGPGAPSGNPEQASVTGPATPLVAVCA